MIQNRVTPLGPLLHLSFWHPHVGMHCYPYIGLLYKQHIVLWNESIITMTVMMMTMVVGGAVWWINHPVFASRPPWEHWAGQTLSSAPDFLTVSSSWWWSFWGFCLWKKCIFWPLSPSDVLWEQDIKIWWDNRGPKGAFWCNLNPSKSVLFFCKKAVSSLL